jgi:diguanylate cyclase (GGDEF)-like protein
VHLRPKFKNQREMPKRVLGRLRNQVTRDPNKLLVVDDDANSLDLLSNRLARNGYAVDAAESGAAALGRIEHCHYDLVLLDQVMPGMSGLDLLRLLRATYSQSELPVIMVSAVDEAQTVVKALDQGANDYVLKPVDMPVVTARIQAQLSRSETDRKLKLLDPLSGLCNRAQLMNRMTEVVHNARGDARGLTSMAVMLLNLDGFRVVNDSFGYPTGDQLLVEVGARLKQAVSEHGLSDATVARMGGDEFGVLIERLESDRQLQTVAEAIVSCLGSPISIRGLLVSIGASLGVAVAKGIEVATSETLLRDAAFAMHQAKALGKNRWQVFDPAHRERAQARMTTALDLRQAVERNELAAVYQPKINLATGAIAGFESLLRWRHPTRGLLNPGDFIAIAEETGSIIPIGEWILGEACRQLKTWQGRFPTTPSLSMNVNLSVKQLKDPKLVSRVSRILQETEIAPETLKLELTESSLMTEVESWQDVVTDLRALRVGLKLDDFGTGYSSLSYLRALHFDSLKIDRSFISRLTADSEGKAIVETIVNLAHALRMTVVAEGIETREQLEALIEMGCDTGQGFYFSRPVDPGAAAKLLESQAPWSLL